MQNYFWGSGAALLFGHVHLLGFIHRQKSPMSLSYHYEYTVWFRAEIVSVYISDS